MRSNGNQWTFNMYTFVNMKRALLSVLIYLETKIEMKFNSYVVSEIHSWCAQKLSRKS